MIILVPVGMNYRTERLPIVTLALIGLNTLVYLVSLGFLAATQGESEKWIEHYLWLIPADSFWWTYLTSMFVHAGIFHLVGNMLFLFLFGCCVEDIIGRWRFLMFYLLGGLAAEFVFIAASPAHFASDIPLGGASGAISTCMGMYLLLRANAQIEFKYFYWLFFIAIGHGEFEVAAWVAIVFWFLMGLLGMVINWLSDSTGGGVAFGAHVGGFLAGLALIGIHKLLPQKREEGDPDFGIPIAHPPAQVTVSATETPAIYIHDAGEQSGPFTLAQIQAMLANGTVSPNAMYWSEGMADWQSVADLAPSPMA